MPSAILDPATSLDPLRCYSVDDAAALLGLSPDTTRLLIASGELAASNVAARGARKARWRVTAADIAEFLGRRRNVAPSPQPHPRRKSPAPGAATYY